MSQVTNIKNCLELFCRSSGQRINEEKTKVFFSHNVDDQQRRVLSQALGFQSTLNLGSYLGVNIFHSRVSKSTFSGVIDKATARLNSWKARTLSLAGRVTLTKSVLGAIPSYVMQSFLIPKSLCEDIDKICRSFIWGGNINRRGIHLMAWEKICQSKEAGGLAMRMSHFINEAFMMKLGWEMCTNPSALWVKVLRDKYKCGTDMIPIMAYPRTSSNCWKGIMESWHMVNQNIGWKIESGADSRFWEDAWILDFGLLKDKALPDVVTNQLKWKVCDVVNDQGMWDMNLLKTVLPLEVCSRIGNMTPPQNDRGRDELFWKASPNGSFSLKSAYVELHGSMHGIRSSNHGFKRIWRWQGPQRIRLHLWKMANNVLLTNEKRFQRGMAASPLCSTCNLHNESPIHALRDCPPTYQLWKKLIPHSKWHKFHSMDMQNWVFYNLFENPASGENWSLKFGVVCDLIWRRRNELIFSHKWDTNSVIIAKLNHSVCDILKARDIDKNLTILKTHHLQAQSRKTWEPPRHDWVKVNCDGAVSNRTSKAACGGFITNHQGDFLMGYAKAMNSMSSIEVELWAIYYGIRFALARGHQQIEVESDSLEAITMIVQGCQTQELQQIVANIVQLAQDAHCVTWKHVFRETNHIADKFAKFGLNLDQETRTFNAPPPFVGNVFCKLANMAYTTG